MANECWNCGNFRAFYSKCYCNFSKENYGFCTNERAVKEKHCSCEKWRNRPNQLKSIRKAVAIRALEDAAVNIAQIKQILEEDRD